MNDVPDTVAELMHGSSGRSELAYRLAWSRTALRRCGLLENSQRGVWSLTESGRSASKEQLLQLLDAIRAEDASRYHAKAAPSVDREMQSESDLEEAWKEKLLSKLREVDPAAFERLCRRMLLESGFERVEVTGKSGDGGIDGKGILNLGLLSFHVLFQCKRYQGSVGSGAVRDFRGAMMGRTDKGLIITTGTFSPDARREATRDGAPPIDLIDGEALCDKLKELALGVETRMVEEVVIKPDWFDQL
jgi:restriction system protein